MTLDYDHDVLGRLRGFLAEGEFGLNRRVPPEREFCQLLGVSRSALRKAMAVLEAEGRIWRHVGRGTLIGARPVGAADGVPAISARTNPAEVMEARLLLEPELARLATSNSTPPTLPRWPTASGRPRRRDGGGRAPGLDGCVDIGRGPNYCSPES